MVVAFLILLALAIFAVAVDSPDLALVMGGLLVILWIYINKVSQLQKRIIELEKRMAAFKATPVQPTPPAAENSPEITPVHGDSDANTKSEIKQPPADQPDTLEFDLPPPTANEITSTASVPRTIAVPRTLPSTLPGVQSRTAPPTPLRNTVRKPQLPPLFEKLYKFAWDWVTDGNSFVRAGMIILFIGMVFLILYAVGEGWIPIELRLAGVAGVAIALIVWGWLQREKRRHFSLIIQGGGIGLLYLTIFASFSRYGVIPSLPAFMMMAVTVILAALMAIRQDARQLAIFATVGGFCAPILTSSGSNNYIGLFSYYTLLNLGVFWIAWYKSWRVLNFTGFLFTFSISTIWGALSYEPRFFATTEPFLIIFFLLYVAIGVLFAVKRVPRFSEYVDSSIIFGTPLLAFGLQCAMVNDYEYGIAISAAVLALFYIVLASLLWKRFGGTLKLLSETFLSLGVIFATLAIPFAIDGTLTGATWALEGLGILWVSIRQQQFYRRLFGAGLILCSGLFLVAELVYPWGEPPPQFDFAFLNSLFIGCVIVAFSASGASWLIGRDFEDKHKIESRIGVMLLPYGVLALILGFEYQIYDFMLYHRHGFLMACFAALSVLPYTLFSSKMEWKAGHCVSVGFGVVIAVAAALCFSYQERLAVNHGYLIWPLTLCIYFYALKQALPSLRQHAATNSFLVAAHVLAALIIVGLLFWDGLWQLLLVYSLLAIVFNQLGNRWQWWEIKILALGFLPVLVLCAIGAIHLDGNLVSLSSVAAAITWPFPPGYLLWPFGFAVYFYLLQQNPTIGRINTRWPHYIGALLIVALLLWLGLWPLVLGASVLTLLCHFLSQRLNWHEMHVTSLGLLPVLILVAAIKMLDGNYDPFYLQDFNLNLLTLRELGYALWPLALGVVFFTYWRLDRRQQSAPKLFHSIALLLLVLLITWEASWHILDFVLFMNAWHLAWLPVCSLLAIALIIKHSVWPFASHQKAHLMYSLPLLVLGTLCWSLLQLLSPADSAPLPWLPLLNPVDVMQAILLFVYWGWLSPLMADRYRSVPRKTHTMVLLGFAFAWINIILLRAVHHWGGVSWVLPDIVQSHLSQTALSLLWALTGLATTIVASRKVERVWWIVGTSLLVVVVIKLFLVDLSARGTVERIISFTGVGLLLVLVGYFSPLPPAGRQQGETDEANHV